MEKIKNKMNCFVMSCRRTFATCKNKAILGLITLCYAMSCPGVVFAGGEEVESVSKRYINQTVDVLFVIIPICFILPGAIHSLMNFKKFVEAQGERDGNASKEAANNMVVGLVLFIVGVLIFSFKSGVLDLINAALA